MPESTLLNARIGWENDHVGAFATATNILNDEHWDYSYTPDDREIAMRGEPRMVGIVLEGRF